MRLMRNLAAGALAGAAGTAAMDLVLWSRARREGAKDSFWRWEFATSVMSWDQASAPGQLGQKALRVVLQREPPDEWARTTTNVVHWATGIGWALQYAMRSTMTTRGRSPEALALGPRAWLASYALLPLAKVYKPIWEYDARTLLDDLSAHMVFGVVTSATLAALTRA